jgi:hypothetical protein
VELVRAVTAALDGLEESGGFSWMSLGGGGPDGHDAVGDAHAGGGRALGGGALRESALRGGALGEGGSGAVEWLGSGAEAEVAALLAADAPESYAVPGVAGVRRWAGLRVGGELAAVAAEAWSAPTVGLLAGVATGARFRGRGLAERVCRWVSRELVEACGRAALMVDDDNAAAITVYERIGYRRRRVLASHVAG